VSIFLSEGAWDEAAVRRARVVWMREVVVHFCAVVVVSEWLMVSMIVEPCRIDNAMQEMGMIVVVMCTIQSVVAKHRVVQVPHRRFRKV
jgi:hypothetical protein